jgi:hypothetical protein
MFSSELKQGRAYKFDVIKEESTRKFFKVRTDDGMEFSLQKFKFQQNAPLPDQIDCYVKSIFPITLGQDISVFIRNFYEEGKEYDFKVKAIRTDTNQVYELQDKHDLCFKLYNAPESLTKGSRIKCKIIKIIGVNVTLKYVGTLSTRLPLEFLDMAQWLNLLGINRFHEYYLNFLESFQEFEPALNKYDDEDPTWILEILQAVSTHITDWLIDCKDDLKLLSKIVRRMSLAQNLALFILEESDYLRNCNPEQRTMLQSRLSNYVELFTQYSVAASMILDKTYSGFIDKMFHRLKEAGYLYRPNRQFRIMMTILKLRPEMINSRMGELFEALHNWELSNWQSEPFRSALVEQLQIFIEGNCRQINLLPAFDSSEENKTVIRMILAIAVQSLLATDTDLVDLRINRAMLYRYISYLNTSSFETLLNKGIDALLGMEGQNEFTWNDTEHPTLLIMKSSSPTGATEERSDIVKTYTTSKAEVQLRSDSLHIVARNANPDSTIIPNNLFDWLNPKVSLADDIHVQNLRKTKDLATYGKMWEEIAWSIFGEDQTAGIKTRKRAPYEGEDVKVIIDDVRIVNSGNERQRLQFHCTIHDDEVQGEGWMPCDTIHLLGWLSYRDIPNNYDGSLSFAQTDNGTPLLFPATVIRRNDQFEFSMKSHLDDFMLENISSYMESNAIVTHFDRANNVWLCLSELGCTFKVNYDESTANLREGMIVRVRYVEPDHSGSMIQFFIGELAENQDLVPGGIKKSECLYNLMQNFGEVSGITDLENSTVVEVEEVMSREEMMELIYMLQRCAYLQTEYIKAFNYLGLATILCKIIEEPTLLEDVATHMELLKLLQDFGRNQRVNLEWLEHCEKRVSRSPMLERLHTRLKIVADLGINENSDWLWNLWHNPRNETEGHLASLVLSYNMLPRDLEKSRKEIMKEISTLLNVNSTVPTSKYYGDESQTVEFKSSLIYSTHGGSRPDVREQLREITHIICGFMNARGGTLYIGVNDAGYENGLDDDLAYRQSHGHKPTIDAMIVDLQNHLDRTLPVHAKDHWEIESDPESKKGVIVVKVLPVEIPVELDGVIFVRSSSTTKPRLESERDEFIKNRSHNYRLLMKLWGVGEEDNSTPSEPQPEEKPVLNNIPKIAPKPEPPKIEEELPEEEEVQDTEQKVTTGRHRFNVLHYFEPNFSTPNFYAYFMRDSKVRVSNDDTYLDYEPDCLLALAIKDREKDGRIILTYADGKVAKHPLSLLQDLNQNETREVRTTSDLRLVNIANDDDYLLSVVKAPYGALFYRLDRLSNMPTLPSLTSEGESLCNMQHRILAQEIVTGERLGFFDLDAVDKERKFFGVPVPVGDGTLSEQERIDALLNPLLPTE